MKVYIKVGQVLLPSLKSKLERLFGESNVVMAPIKSLERSSAKIRNDYESKMNREKGNLSEREMNHNMRDNIPPLAARLLDYLRATVFCEDIEKGAVEVLKKLTDNFEVVQIKQRIVEPVDNGGNPVILVNLVIEDETHFKAKYYPWSNWWVNDKGERKQIKMIGEVQIIMKELYYLMKLDHTLYEIVRAKNSSEWVYLQGFGGIDVDLLPSSPLHNDIECLL